MHRRTILGLVAVVLVLGVGTAVASGVYRQAEVNPGDSPLAPEAESTLDRSDAVADLAEPSTEARTGAALAAMPEVAIIVDALAGDAKPETYFEDPAFEAVRVGFILPNGDGVLINVQRRTSIERPGSHIRADWSIGAVDGWESARSPRDEFNSVESLWVLTDNYQIGVVLNGGSTHEITSSVEANVPEVLIKKVATALEAAYR